jgi:hypothetical protein
MENNGKPTTMADAPIELTVREAMNNLAAALDKILNGEKIDQSGGRQNGFVLLLFPYGDKSGRCNYVSNGANREDIVKMFKEQIKQFEEMEMANPLTDAEAAESMQQINAICREFNERKIDRAEARRRLEENKVAFGIDPLLDSYDPDIP